MAKYTVELRRIIESGTNIFDFPYEFYDPSKKAEFERKFINHFYFCEIGVETTGRFIHNLRCKFDEVFPYYNMLLKTTQVDYDLLNNYDMTEEFTKTKKNSKDVVGNARQRGSTDERTDLTEDRSNNMDSTTEHSEDVSFNKNETQKDKGEINKEGNTVVDDRKVESETPASLLSMENIKGNVYASKADIQDAKTDTKNKETSSAEKENELKEETKRTTKDTVDARSSEEIDQRKISEIDINSTTDTTQNETGNETENYKLTRKGNIGVMAGTDMLEKHIILQKKLATIETTFFNECNDLFMQIF